MPPGHENGQPRSIPLVDLEHGSRGPTTNDEINSDLSDSTLSSPVEDTPFHPHAERRRTAWDRAVAWLEGPSPPRPYRIKPLFERLQTLPLYILDKIVPSKWQKYPPIAGICFLWLLMFVSILHRSNAGNPTTLDGLLRASCISTLW